MKYTKKMILLILVVIMIIPFMVKAETCDNNKVSISSITIEEKSDNVKELHEATMSGKNINLDLAMYEVGDIIKYKIVMKNDSNEDFALDNNILNISTDYIDYILESDDSSNIVKANSNKTVYLRVEYKNEVPENKYELGSYNDNKSLKFQMSTGNTENNIMNPKTGDQSYISISIIILLISMITYLLLRKNKKIKFIAFIIGATVIIPTSVYAICKCEMAISSNVQIMSKEKVAKVYYSYCISQPLKEYDLPYQEGMTGITFMDSDYKKYVPKEFIMSLYDNFASLYEFDPTDNIKSCINSKELIVHPKNEEERQINRLYDDNLEQCINDLGTMITNPNEYIYPANKKEYLIRDSMCPTY